MSDPLADRPFPRGALFGVAALLGITILAVSAARLSDVGKTQMPETAAVESRELRFADRADGAVEVIDADSVKTIEVFSPGTHGFVRGVMRGLARERRLHEIGAQPPFRLTRWADGRLSLDDPTTGRRIDLAAFGPVNAASFAQLLNSPANLEEPNHE